MNHSGHRIGFAVATGAGGAETLSAHAPLALRRMPARALAAAALVAVAAILAFTLTGGHSPAVSTSAAPATAAQGWSFVPLAEQTSVSGSLGAQLPAFWAVRASTGAVSLHNSAQGLSATLERGAIALSGNHGLSLGLAALSLGRAGTLAPVSALGAAQVTHNRIVFSSAAISEWFVNGPRGLEQGFTLARRPAGSGSLEISQQLSGDLSARVSASGHEVSFSSAAGALRYENLSVTDARGAQIPATLAVTGKRLQITINDAAAVYPLSVDPIIVTPVTQNPIANATTGADPYWVAFSPNGKLLATANYTDSTVSVFTVDPASGQVAPVTQALASNADTASGPFSVAFSPNGKLLATASFSNDEVSLFSIDPSSGQLTPVVQSVAANADTGSGPCSLAFSPNGDLLATANFGDNTASVLAVDPSSGQLTPVTQSVATNADTGVGPYSVAFSPSGGLLATANYDSDTLSLFTVAATSGQLTPVTQTVAANADTGSGPVSVAFSPNWGLLATANYDSDTVSLFTVDAATGQLTPVSESPASNENTGTRPVGVAFSPNGGLLATANLSDDSLSVYTVTGPSAHAALALAPSSITADGVASTLATVTLTDANGNPVSGDTVTFTSTGSQLIGPVTAGTTPGTYTARITSTTTAGTVSITATDTSVGGITASQTLTQTPGAATAVALTLAPASITANGLSTSVATATVTDAHGNRVSGDAVTIRSNDGQQIGPVTAGTTPGTYEATITSTTTPGGAAITATDTSAGALAAVATLTQTSLPPAINAPPAQIAAASTFKIVSHKRLADGDIVVTLKLTGAGTIKAAGMHPSAHTAKDSHIAWGPVTVVRTKAGLFKVTLRPDKGAKLLISNARSIGSSLHVTVTVHFNPAKGSKQKKVLTVLLFKGRKL